MRGVRRWRRTRVVGDRVDLLCMRREEVLPALPALQEGPCYGTNDYYSECTTMEVLVMWQASCAPAVAGCHSWRDWRCCTASVRGGIPATWPRRRRSDCRSRSSTLGRHNPQRSRSLGNGHGRLHDLLLQDWRGTDDRNYGELYRHSLRGDDGPEIRRTGPGNDLVRWRLDGRRLWPIWRP